MKTFQMPVSDCGMFCGGVIDDSTVTNFLAEENDPPKHGIIIWYRDKEATKAALQAVSDAHWPDPH